MMRSFRDFVEKMNKASGDESFMRSDKDKKRSNMPVRKSKYPYNNHSGIWTGKIQKKKRWWKELTEGKYLAPGSEESKILIPVNEDEFAEFSFTREDLKILLSYMEDEE